MPVHNGEKTIANALDSLLCQTHENFELFISDNASTDRTADICREYASKDNRVHYLRKEADVGAIANFNSVLPIGKGQFFMWAGADDRWEPCFIEELHRLLCANNTAVLAFCEMYQRELPIDRDYPVKSLLGFNTPESMTRRLARFALFPEVESKGSLVYGLIRRDAIAGIGFLSQNHTLFRLAMMGSFVISPRRLFYKGFKPVVDIENIMTSPREIFMDYRDYRREVAETGLGEAQKAFVDAAALAGCSRRIIRNSLGRLLLRLRLRRLEPLYYRIFLRMQRPFRNVSMTGDRERNQR
jgi:glycosyltransferase involved in cell wall biosynthesis